MDRLFEIVKRAALRAIFGIVVAFFASSGADAAPRSPWTFFKPASGQGKRNFTYSFEMGARYSFHYNRERVTSTPPESLLGETQLNFWYRHQVSLYCFFSTSVAMAPHTVYGGGVKIPFSQFGGDVASPLGGLKLMIVVDYGIFAYRDFAQPVHYETEGSMIRYGGEMALEFGQSGVYFQGSVMVTNMNGNFFLAPLVAIGFHF